MPDTTIFMLRGIYHVNVNTRDFARALAFYELLGFRVVRDLGEHQGPALATGLAQPEATIRAALLRLGEEPRATYLDLVEWKQPATAAAPYPTLHNVGIARLSLLSDDLDGDYQRLVAAGVQFLSSPQRFDDQTRYAVFRDPDGTFLQLLERQG